MITRMCAPHPPLFWPPSRSRPEDARPHQKSLPALAYMYDHTLSRLPDHIPSFKHHASPHRQPRPFAAADLSSRLSLRTWAVHLALAHLHILAMQQRVVALATDQACGAKAREPSPPMMHKVSSGVRQVRPPFQMAMPQQCRGPPGLVEQPLPSHVLHADGQQTARAPVKLRTPFWHVACLMLIWRSFFLTGGAATAPCGPSSAFTPHVDCENACEYCPPMMHGPA